MKSRLKFPLFFLLLISAGTLRAQSVAPASAVTIQMDPAQSKILWTLPDVLHTVHGSFQLASGAITFQPQSGAASGLFTVNEETGASGDGARDRRMKRSILEIAKYPTATFRPTHVTGAYHAPGASTLVVDGVFHLHGADHPLQLTFQVESSGSHVVATTKFDIPYVAWGMRDPSTLFLRVGKSVQMEIDAQGTVQTAP
ncbi:MAG: YceI family protein [Acidobacteriaceae bacterium]